jgi:2-amino-4-hydroxy-6-hydroxymethyldihydropteridine diphosphokinase
MIINTLVLRMEKLIFLSLGSNLGSRETNILGALKLIQKQVGRLEKISRFYESEPWGFSSKNFFYNCCVSLRSSMPPLELMERLLDIEREMGRHREGRGYGDRLIDIDMLFYGDRQMDHPELKLPHPAMGDRRFVLAPLAEIASGIVHPVAGIPIAEMLLQCPDRTKVVALPDTRHQSFFNNSSSQNI